MALDKKEHIRKFIKSRIGDPIAPLCEGDTSAIDEAFETASVDYWIALPYVKKDDHGLSTKGGELSIDITNQLQTQLPTNLHSDAYFIGIVREDMTRSLIPQAGHQQYFDRRLLGGNVNYSPENFPTVDPRYEADRQQYLQSTEELFFGETDISIDQIENAVKVAYPPVEGQLHLWWAYGFCPDKTVELLPMNHLKLFRKMVALEFIEIVLASRTPVQLSGDFTIDVSDLQDKRDRLREELEQEIPEAALYVAIMA